MEFASLMPFARTNTAGGEDLGEKRDLLVLLRFLLHAELKLPRRTQLHHDEASSTISANSTPWVMGGVGSSAFTVPSRRTIPVAALLQKLYAAFDESEDDADQSDDEDDDGDDCKLRRPSCIRAAKNRPVEILATTRRRRNLASKFGRLPRPPCHHDRRRSSRAARHWSLGEHKVYDITHAGTI
jgi:hypothetical protein